MPGPQWKSGHPPKGTRITSLLVVGPDSFEDEKHVWWHLDRITARMEAVEVMLIGGDMLSRNEGVSRAAFRWAEREWWPRWFYDPRTFKPNNLRRVLRERLQFTRGHVVVFREFDDPDYEFVEWAREAAVSPKRFHLVRC